MTKPLTRLTSNSDFGGRDIYTEIKRAVQLALSRPYGKKGVGIDNYFKQFNDSQLDRFIEKLKESKWVRNSNFNYDLIVRDDLVNKLIGGLSDISMQSKYYNITTLILEKVR